MPATPPPLPCDAAPSNHQAARTLLLVDGSSYLYRAYHAMPDLRAVASDPSSPATGAIRGMLNMLQSLQKDVPAELVACVFDAKGPNFRDHIYPAYKQNRSPMPDDLRSQIEPIHHMVRLLGWPVLVVPGVEADDVIGTLAVIAAGQGTRVLISSGDKDLAQLVNEHITIVDTMNGKRRDIAGVRAEFGVDASLMVDFQTLVGDTADNVPGVAKVGPKTAAKWLNEYGSLDQLISHAHDIKGMAGENLRQALPWLPTARALLTIKTDCDLSAWLPNLPALHGLEKKTPDLPALQQFYAQYGFKSLAQALKPDTEPAWPKGTSSPHQDDLFAPLHASQPDTADPASRVSQAAQPLQAAHTPQASAPHYETILTWPHFESWLARLHTAELVAIDTETTSLDAMQAQILGISLSIKPGWAAYLPLGHIGPQAPEQLPRDDVLARLRPWLEDPSQHKLGQHIKYDRHVFANHGIEVQGYVHDTMLQSYVLEAHKPHNLSSLAQRHLGLGGTSYEDLCGKGAHQIPFAQVDLEKAAPYACEDSDQTLAVHLALWPQIQASAELAFIYQLEIASSHTLYQIERHGVLIDAPTLAKQSHALGSRIHALEQQAYELAGQPFNLASPKQLGEIFFDKLGLPVVKKTATGARSTDEEVLEKLAADYPLPAALLEHRRLSKLKGTYTDKLAKLANPRTARVHTHYAQAVAVTGRLSSADPNLQNIPIRTPEGRQVRQAFVAPPGWFIASADYSQIELRIMAHISGDAALLKAFHEGIDVHRATAGEIFGLPAQEVSPQQRRYAKVINFGLIYGMSAYGLAKALGIDNTAAKNYITRYFDRFAGVKQYMDDTRAQAKAQGYVQTVFGRRLYLPEINSPNGPRRSGAERAAINAPMQGSAADLIKLSMVAVQKALNEQHKHTKMIMQVHDELVFEVPQEELSWVKAEIPAIMARVAQLKVPLVADIGVGLNWDEAH